jgi:hypothetical protein
MKTIKNKPYVKQFEKGVLINPITKEKPYLNNPNVSLFKLMQHRLTGRFRIWEPTFNKFFKGKSPVKA